MPLRYHKDPEKSAATFVTVERPALLDVGRLRGRRSRRHDDACSGRGSVCINSGGEKIYPEEVEAALKAHAAVFDVVVVGVPDERWGERVAAVVEMRPDHDGHARRARRAHARTHVAGYKVPRELHVVDKIERSPSGKPDYPWAKKIATGAQ